MKEARGKSGLISGLNDVGKILSSLRKKKLVLLGGCFDLLHFGHISFLGRAKNLGDILIVALECDEFIKRRKKKIPIHSQEERAKILASLRMVDLVILLPFFARDDDYLRLVKIISPRIIAITEGDPQRWNKTKFAKAVGARVVATPIIKRFSSSSIVSYAPISGN